LDERPRPGGGALWPESTGDVIAVASAALFTVLIPNHQTTMITKEKLDRMDQCRHLLDAPAPQVVGELIDEIRRLRTAMESGTCAKCALNGWSTENNGPCPKYPKCEESFPVNAQADPRHD